MKRVKSPQATCVPLITFDKRIPIKEMDFEHQNQIEK